MDLTTVYKKSTAVVSSVVQATAVCTPQHCDSSVKILYFCTLRSCSTTLRQLCWRMSFLIPANICYCSIIKYCSKVSFQLLLISCGWELHHMLRNSHRMLWESHSARNHLSGNFFHKSSEKPTKKFHLVVPQRLRKRGVLSKSSVLAHCLVFGFVSDWHLTLHLIMTFVCRNVARDGIERVATYVVLVFKCCYKDTPITCTWLTLHVIPQHLSG